MLRQVAIFVVDMVHTCNLVRVEALSWMQQSHARDVITTSGINQTLCTMSMGVVLIPSNGPNAPASQRSQRELRPVGHLGADHEHGRRR